MAHILKIRKMFLYGVFLGFSLVAEHQRDTQTDAVLCRTVALVMGGVESVGAVSGVSGLRREFENNIYREKPWACIKGQQRTGQKRGG